MLGKVVYGFFGNLFTDLFHGIYKQQIEPQKAKKGIIAVASVAVITTIGFSGVNYFYESDLSNKFKIEKEVKKPEIKKEVKKPEIKKDVKKPEIKKPEIKKPDSKKKK